MYVYLKVAPVVAPVTMLNLKGVNDLEVFA
jgi:hypothetical protein